MATKDIREDVQKRYGDIASRQGASCCGSSPAASIGKQIGYDEEDLGSVPEGSNLGLGCGNPVAIAAIRDGDTVLDLGSGAGFDCFLAAKKVGEKGRVIGVDMTAEMLAKARANAEKGGYTNVEFREGHIESLPVEDNSVDIVISNCVINLSPDKDAVFREIHRVLRPGGRFFVSDIVLLRPLPEAVRNSEAMYSSCVSGALLKKDYLAAMTVAGLQEIHVAKETKVAMDLLANDPCTSDVVSQAESLTPEVVRQAMDSVLSVHVQGKKGFDSGLACCGGVC